MKEETSFRVVCDTSVLLSMLGFPGGRLDALWEIIRDEKFELCLSEFILEELAKNLRLKARLEPKEIAQAIDILKGHAHMVSPHQTLHVIRRKDSDNRILECALEAQ